MVVVIAVRVANTSWLLNVQNRGLSVPGVLVHSQVSCVVILLVRTILLHKCQHGRTTWSAIEPNNQRICCGILLTLNQEVMDLLRGVFDWHVARVNSEVKWVDVWQLRNQLLLRFSAD